MSAFTLATAQAQLATYIAAETALVSGGVKSYSIGTRAMQREDLKEIRDGIQYWNLQVNRLLRSSPGARIRRAVPFD